MASIRATDIRCLLPTGIAPLSNRRHADRLGGYATFAELSGWVAPGGAVALSSQIARLQGQFQGGHFEGPLQYHERGSDRLTCGYTLKLERAG
jgi:hypothetical protein